MELNLLDRYDHTGMYSKAGRAAIERFTILQHVDEILNPKKHSFNSNSSPTLKKEFDSSPNLHRDKTGLEGVSLLFQKDLEKTNQVKHEETAKKEKNKKSPDPWSKIVSRNQREATFQPKRGGPNNGNYNPKYSLIERSPGVYIDFKRSELAPTKSEKNLIHNNNNNSSPKINHNTSKNDLSQGLKTHKSLEASNFLTSKSLQENDMTKKKHANSSFDLQLSRDDVYKSYNKYQLEKPDRFLSVELPSNLSGHMKVVIPDISKNKGRGDAEFLPRLKNCPTYEPNYEFVQKRLDKGNHSLDKMLPRISLEKKNIILHETIFDPTEYAETGKSITLPKIVSPNFNRMLARDTKDDSKFPGYLQGLSSRWSVNIVNEKSLIQNNYKEGRFQTNLSSFDHSMAKDEILADPSNIGFTVFTDIISIWLDQTKPNHQWVCIDSEDIEEDGINPSIDNQSKPKNMKLYACGGITIAGTIDLHIFKDGQLDDDPKNYLKFLKKEIPLVKKLMPCGFIWMDDSNYEVKAFLESQNINVMKWPNYSYDLNPIESIWSWLKKKCNEDQPKTIQDLKKSLKKYWKSITLELLASYYDGLEQKFIDI